MNDWPEQPEIKETGDALTEKREPKIKAMMAIEEDTTNTALEFMNEMLQRFNYWKLLRITAWILRFKTNCLGQRSKGPLTTEEITNSETLWIILIQKEGLFETKEDKIQDKDIITHLPNPSIKKIKKRMPKLDREFVSNKHVR